jgi:hypothetical protein
MTGQQFLVDAGAVVVAVEIGGRGHADEVLEARLVHGEERQVERRILHPRRAAVPAAAGGDVGLVADDRVDAGVAALGVELEGPVEISVVSDGAGVHAQRLHLLNQIGDLGGPVEEAVVGVAVQVNERA